MPPKVKITKEGIIATAVDVVRKEGVGALNARTVATRLGCSTQPVFSNFETMDQLREAVIKEAEVLSGCYMEEEMARGKYPSYKASGMAYIRFASEEKELFKLLYMRERVQEDMKPSDSWKVVALVQKNLGLSQESAERFHLEMWAFVHGIAAMLATNYLELSTDMVSQMLTDVYQGLMKHYKENV